MGDNKDITNIITDYIKNNDLIKNNVTDEYTSIADYQSKLKTKYNSPIKSSKTTDFINTVANTTPLNNINFINGIDDAMRYSNKDGFKESAFYLLSSLQSTNNQFFIDKNKLITLFKSGLGIMDLPYSLILYLGGLHYFNKNPKVSEKYDFYRLPVKLDGDTVLNINPSWFLGLKFNKIKLLNDSNYKTKYNSFYIPKFGYGTLSNFMHIYYKFIYNKTAYDSGFKESSKDTPFHIYGANEGFVKSFKSYSDSNINFMGHYTILKNSYNFSKGLVDNITVLTNDFKEAATTSIQLPSFNYNSDGFKKMFLVYSKLKTAYLYKAGNVNTTEKLVSFIKSLNENTTPVIYNYVNGSTLLKTKCSPFSFFVYGFLFNKNKQLDLNIDLKKLMDDFRLPLSLTADLVSNTFVDPNIEHKTLCNFLKVFWDSEMKTMDKQRRTFDQNNINTSNFLILLHPSAGGVFMPNNLFNTPVNISKDSISSDNLHNISNLLFDNKSVIENSTRMLWYDSGSAGYQLGSKDLVKLKMKNSGSPHVDSNYKVDSVTYSDSLLTERTHTGTNNFFNTIYKQPNGSLDLTNINGNIKELYEFIDLEKFDYFEKVFIDFCKFYDGEDNTVFNNNNNNFNFQTLLKAITTVNENNISSNDMKIIDSTLSLDDMYYYLIGYSSYNYYFADYSNISKIINSFLTLAQYNKNEGDNGIFNEFLTQKLSVNNYSTIGSVTTDDTTIYTNYQNFMFRPDVIFSDIIKDGKGDFGEKNSLLPYYIKKMIFGDNHIEQYSPLTADKLAPEYVKTYINKINSFTNSDIINHLKYFFKYINVQLNYNTFKILYNLFIGYMNSTDTDISVYLSKFITYFYNKSTSNINIFLSEVNTRIEDKLNPNSSTSLFKSVKKEDDLVDLKTSTYYNIKNIIDKYIVYQPIDLQGISTKYSEYEDLSTDGIFSNTKGMLFYNYIFKDFTSNESMDVQDSIISKSKYDPKTPKHLAEYMQIVDRANNDIGGDLLIDVVQLAEQIELKFDPNKSTDNTELTNKSVYSVFSTIAGNNGFMLHPINSYVDYYSNFTDGLVSSPGLLNKYAHNMFGLHTSTDRIDSNPSFILQWANHTSSLETNKTNTSSNLNLSNSFALDIDLQQKIVSNQKNIPEDILNNGKVTSFIVDFGNQNQNMFKNIQLDTTEFSNTEESINAYVNLISKSDNKDQIVSGNLFKLMESRSYTCQVETMGNVLIQPLNYFYLRNVPLFKGSYWITNVEHKLTPNNMVTTFKGVRQPIVSKTNNRSEVLRSIEKTINEIQKQSTPSIENNKSVGDILQDRNAGGTDNPYGVYYQKLVNSPQFISTDGIQILYSLIYSEFGSINDIYKLFISVLYNRAKYWANIEEQSVSPNIVTKYMVDMALSLKANYSGADVKSYFNVDNPNNNGSLSYMVDKFPIDKTNPIFVLLNQIGKSKTTSDVNKLLTPTNLTLQKLKITVGGTGKNISDTGTSVFYENGADAKQLPNINFIDIDDNKDFTNSWRAFDIIYMKNVMSEPVKIYSTTVNNEDILEYKYLDGLAINTLKINTDNSIFKYLGCYNNQLGISFFGRIYNELNVDGYGISTSNSTTLLNAYSSVSHGNTSVVHTTDNIKKIITLSGYDPNSPIGVMSGTIASREGYVVPVNNAKGNLAYRNNNPGNLVYSDEYLKYDSNLSKVTTTDSKNNSHTWAVFSKPEYGMKALIEGKIQRWANGNMPPYGKTKYPRVFNDWDKGLPPSFLQFFYTYAPPSDKNDTVGYAKTVVNSINKISNGGYTINSKVKDAIA